MRIGRRPVEPPYELNSEGLDGSLALDVNAMHRESSLPKRRQCLNPRSFSRSCVALCK
jgi:hypothetical protein